MPLPDKYGHGCDIKINTGIGLRKQFFNPKYDGIFWLPEDKITEIQNMNVDAVPDITDPIKNGDYYFAYFKELKSTIKFMWHLRNVFPEDKLNFIMPYRAEVPSLEGIKRYIKEIVGSPQLGKLIYTDLRSDNKQEFQFDGPGEANIYYSEDGFEHDHFLCLMNHTKYPFVGITGDQSLGEALSLGKIPLYEVLSHKANIIPALSLWVTAHKSSFPHFQDFFLKGRLGHRIQYTIEEHIKFINNQDAFFFEEYKNLLNKLREDFDLDKTIGKYVKSIN